MSLTPLKQTMLLSPLIFMCILTTGCATITGSESQNVAVEARTQDGEIINGADCTLTNNRGSWSTKTPNGVMVLKSSKDLRATCSKNGYPVGSSTVESSMNGGMVGNIVFGGVIGAVVDHSKGTAYNYPDSIPVVMGTSKFLGKVKAKTTPDAYASKKDKDSDNKKG